MRRGLMRQRGRSGWWLIVMLLGLAAAGWYGVARSHAAVQGSGFGPPEAAGQGRPPAEREFTRPDLYLSTTNVPLSRVRDELPSRQAWEDLLARLPRGTGVHIDPRSGAASGIVTRVPLLPGDGDGNSVTLEEIGAGLGRPVRSVDARAVADVTLAFIRRHAAALGIKPSQLGRPVASRVSEHLWQVDVPQEVRGVPVRHARVSATISRGNLILLGTEAWGDVWRSPRPVIDADEAVRLGFEHSGGAEPAYQVVNAPRLEFWPADPAGWSSGPGGVGPLGKGYTHYLVWVFEFLRIPDEENWQVAVDAVSGEVVSFHDLNTYAKKKIKGGVYPAASNSVGPCPGPVCGISQPGYPVPWADTGLAAPNDFTNSAGVFDYSGGTVTTTLTGKYADITDTCGTISVSSANGDIDLGGGGVDCFVPPGTSPGNTASARTVFYEFNKIAEIGRSWLPSNTWLQSRQDITTTINKLQPCNAFFTNQGKFRFHSTMGGEACSRCNSPGQTASVIDHEFAHGLDKNDATPSIGIFGEGFADIVAAYRQQQSCIGYGMRTEPQCESGEYQICFDPTEEPPPPCPDRCGIAPDGLYNAYENVGFSGIVPNPGPHCTTECSGGRDLDYAKHADGIPDTPQNFVCTQCPAESGGPCGKDKYCAMAPMRQAAWDLATRDLPAQHGYDLNTSFVVASRILYQSSGNTSAWHSCNCAAGTSDGCGASSGYNQWLASDDDDGNPLDGTPHMVAIYNAFNRHNVACSTPTVQNNGCEGGPTSPPALTVTGACGAVELSWTSVPGASNYQVFRTEGHNGCDLGKALIAAGPQTSLQDTAVADGREYSYMVLPMTSTASCVGPGSACFAATPTPITGDPLVTVNWPNGRNVLFVNTAVNLTWTATDTCGGVTSVDIHLSRNGPGGPFEVIALGVPNTGSHNWLVTGPATSNAFLKVTARDPGMFTGSDLSDAAFSISTGCGPCVVSWCKEEMLRCTWNNTCGPGACCNYTCAYDSSCLGIETCPENACNC